MPKLAETPNPPYYAVIFTSIKSPQDASHSDYENTANRMIGLASQQPGFLGVDSARETIGITVSYWKNLSAISAWKKHSEHLMAQQKGRSDWYSQYKVRIAKVERSYGFD